MTSSLTSPTKTLTTIENSASKNRLKLFKINKFCNFNMKIF